ncbi:replication protein A 70 kDa DNA-binding subunit B-like protein [Tanacetum coccineum]
MSVDEISEVRKELKCVVLDIDGSDSNDVNNNTLFCRTCQSIVNSPVPRFKVVVSVQDGTRTASFVLFHREVRRLLTDHTVVDILERKHQDGEVDGILKHSYTVLKLCDDNDVIKSMVRDSDVHEDVVAMESIKNDEPSNGCFDSKDVVSCTGDSLGQ